MSANTSKNEMPAESAVRVARQAMQAYNDAHGSFHTALQDSFLIACHSRRHGLKDAHRVRCNAIIDDLGKMERDAFKAQQLACAAANLAKKEGNWALVHEMIGSASEGRVTGGLAAAAHSRQLAVSAVATDMNDLISVKTPTELEVATRKAILRGYEMARATARGVDIGLSAEEREKIVQWYSEASKHYMSEKQRRDVAETIAPRVVIARLDMERISEEFEDDQDVLRYIREMRVVAENDISATLVDHTDKSVQPTLLDGLEKMSDKMVAAELMVANKLGLDMSEVYSSRHLVLRLPADREFDKRVFAAGVYEAVSSAIMASIGADLAYAMDKDLDENKSLYSDRYADELNLRAQARRDRDMVVRNYTDGQGKLSALHPEDVVNALTWSKAESASRDIPSTDFRATDLKGGKSMKFISLEAVARAMRKGKEQSRDI